MTVPPDVAAADSATTASGLLADTYRRLVDVCEALTVHIAGPGPAATPGGVSGAELTAHPETLDAFVEAAAVRLSNRHGAVARRDAAATHALHRYVWAVGLLMSGAWYLERRVPRIKPQDVRLDLTAGTLAVVPRSNFACLPDDRAAWLPGTRALAHEEALRSELRAALADHVRPLLTAIGPHVRRGPRALWGMVADDLVSGIWSLGRVLGREEHAVRAATELLPTAIPPLPGGANFRHLTGSDGRTYPTRTRLGCCLHYTIGPAQACITCPRTSETERLRRLEC